MSDNDLQAVEKLHEAYRQITRELDKVIVGQQEVIEQLLIAMFARGHCLLVGVPGLAKTLMIRSVADALSLDFNRIQFTPDLMPSDITGTEVIQEDKATGDRQLRFLPGPVFANIVLADEINRTPPKTQAALLEAMQEHQVTAGGQRHKLPQPFFVLATQNPIEQEGTYPLPEAQLDRFMFSVFVDYPDENDELEIVKRTTADLEVQVTPTLDAAGDHAADADRPPRADRRPHRPLRAAAGPPDAPPAARSAGIRPPVRDVGRRPAGQPVPGAGRQGPRDPAGPLLRQPGRHPLRRPAGAAAPHQDQLQRRRGGRVDRRHRPPLDRVRSASHRR